MSLNFVDSHTIFPPKSHFSTATFLAETGQHLTYNIWFSANAVALDIAEVG